MVKVSGIRVYNTIFISYLTVLYPWSTKKELTHIKSDARLYAHQVDHDVALF